MKHDLWTVSDFCALNAISSSTFYKEVKAGRLKIVKFGDRTLVTASARERWLTLYEGWRYESSRRYLKSALQPAAETQDTPPALCDHSLIPVITKKERGYSRLLRALIGKWK